MTPLAAFIAAEVEPLLGGQVSILHVVLGLLVVQGLAIILCLGMCSLNFQRLSSVRARMVTSQDLQTLGRDLETHLSDSATEHKEEVAELRVECRKYLAQVSGVEAGNQALIRQVELMSHNLAKVYEGAINRLIDLAAQTGQRTAAAAGSSPAPLS